MDGPPGSEQRASVGKFGDRCRMGPIQAGVPDAVAAVDRASPGLDGLLAPVLRSPPGGAGVRRQCRSPLSAGAGDSAATGTPGGLRCGPSSSPPSSPRGDLHRSIAGLDPDDDWVVAEPLHLVRARGTPPVQTVDGHELVAEQERRLRPDQYVIDPAAVAALPLRAQPGDLPVGCPDDAAEGAGLAPHPALAAEQDRDDDDQVHVEQGQQCDQQSGPPSSETLGGGPRVSTASPEQKCGPSTASSPAVSQSGAGASVRGFRERRGRVIGRCAPPGSL
jgi:hypothetical protein